MRANPFCKLISICIITIVCFSCSSVENKPSIIPQPMSVTGGVGHFKLSKNIEICYQSSEQELQPLAEMYASMIKQISDIELSVEPKESDKNSGAINIFLDSSLDSLGKEGYVLNVTPRVIDIRASSAAGVLYAMYSLEQITNGDKVDVVSIVDKPRFEWRGMMLDVARHFYDKDYIKRFIDIISYHKMNKLHLHLTDGIGWRIEIEKYPKLTSMGAYRKVTENAKSWENFGLYDGSSPLNSEQWYGGYLTKSDIREIVKYAEQKYIEVIPEIEVPGHSMAALACYPEFTCPNVKGGADVYCAGNEETFKFIDDIIVEVAELFPSKYIHVGGDEVGKEQWTACPKCKARMTKEGLKSSEELQSYFMKRVEKNISSLGKKLVGWDEILQGGLPPSATVMSWTGLEGGIAAANLGHDVIMAPMSHCYFDHYQGDNNHEPQGWGGYTSIEKVYSLEPIPDKITSDKRSHILGAQANLWTETIATPSHVEYMIMPRLAALSEVVWSNPENKNWDTFKIKLDKQFDHYDAKGYNYSESSMTPLVRQTMLGEDTLEVELYTELGGYPIHYTLDGTTPTENSPIYSNPIKLSECTDLNTVTFRNNKQVGYVQKYDMLMNKAVGATVKYEYPYSSAYSGGGDFAIVDNKTAIKRGDSPLWQGVEKNDFIVTLDMKESKEISKIKLSYFQHLSTTSVVLPTEITVLSSVNGEDFKEIEKFTNVSDINRDGIIKKLYIEKEPFLSRYIKVISKNIGVLPEGYNRAGSNAWVFMDEIAVN